MPIQKESIEIWCCRGSAGNGLPPQETTDLLTRAGLKVISPDGTMPSGPGVLFLEAVTPDSGECVREYSRGGLQRVVVVADRQDLLGGEAWRLLNAGASDVLAWDASSDIATVLAARFQRWEEIDRIVDSPLVRKNLIGKSRAWRQMLRQVIEVARFSNSSILITGESGTGKELIARLVHTLDTRSGKGDLVVLDCTTVVPELSGSEFFGHERGAFTNAIAPRDGAFALANGGTLFLDEVGDLPLTLQAELLRVVQEGTYKRVGSNEWKQTRFRLICATNRDLLHEETNGNFRRDFYFRIAGSMFRLPPLRERVEDILPLARHFAQQMCSAQEPPEFDETVREYLLTRPYPGNIRDLKQLVARIFSRHTGPGPITPGDIPEEERPMGNTSAPSWYDGRFTGAIEHAVELGVGLKEIGRYVSESAIEVALHQAGGSIQQAARKLGITDRALQMRVAARRQNGNGNGHAGPAGDEME